MKKKEKKELSSCLGDTWLVVFVCLSLKRKSHFLQVFEYVEMSLFKCVSNLEIDTGSPVEFTSLENYAEC